MTLIHSKCIRDMKVETSFNSVLPPENNVILHPVSRWMGSNPPSDSLSGSLSKMHDHVITVLISIG